MEKKYNFYGLAFADKIYDIAKEIFFMKNKDRSLLQSVGEKLREIDPYVWINYTYNKANEYANVVVSDCRKIEELEEGIKLKYIPIRVVCDRDVAIQRIINRDGYCDETLLDNYIETGTRSIEMIEIYNNGSIEELHEQIDNLIIDLIKNVT